MSETKAKRLIVACTVGAVLLIVFLISVLTYQLAAMLIENKRIERLDLAIATYEKSYEELKGTKELCEQRWWIEREARELGLVYPDLKD